MDPHLKSRLLNEILTSSAVLASLESAAPAEAWASGAIAEWLDFDQSPDELVAELAEVPLAAAVVAWLVKGTHPPGDLGGAEKPEWLERLSRPTANRAVQLVAAASSDRALVITYNLGTPEEHDVSISFEQGQVRSLTIGGGGLLEGLEDQPVEMTASEIGLENAISEVRAGLASADLGRLTADSMANVALFERRFEVSIGGTRENPTFDLRPRSAEIDRVSAGVIRAALRKELSGGDMPPELNGLLQTLAEKRDRLDPDFLTLSNATGVPATIPVDVAVLLELAAGYVAPTNLGEHDADEAELIAELEHADWIGAILGCYRATVGTEVTGEFLVDCVNRCPEITTSIPKADRPAVSWAFERTLYAWEVCGVLDADGHITSFGKWLLPRAAIARWEPSAVPEVERPRYEADDE